MYTVYTPHAVYIHYIYITCIYTLYLHYACIIIIYIAYIDRMLYRLKCNTLTAYECYDRFYYGLIVTD